MGRRGVSIVLTGVLLAAGCASDGGGDRAGGPQPVAVPAVTPAPAAPAQATATLVYTASQLRQTRGGYTLGKGTLNVATTSAACAADRAWMPGIPDVTSKQPQISVALPAGQPLIVTSAWSGPHQSCILQPRLLQAVAGARYRLTQLVDAAAGTCGLRFEQQQGSGQYRELNPMPLVSSVCAGR